MSRPFEAIYENGILRPLHPLPLNERQRVMVVIDDSSDGPERAYHDIAYRNALRKELAGKASPPSIDEVLRLTAKDATLWSEAIDQEREERI